MKMYKPVLEYIKDNKPVVREGLNLYSSIQEMKEGVLKLQDLLQKPDFNDYLSPKLVGFIELVVDTEKE